MSVFCQLADVGSMLGTRTGDPVVPVVHRPETPIASRELREPSFPDERLHETLLRVFHDHVDPLIRLLHWPSFEKQCRAFWKRRSLHIPVHAQLRMSPGPQYSTNYFPRPSYETPQTQLYPGPPDEQPQSQASYENISDTAEFDTAFMAVLYSIYYAAAVSLLDNRNPPDLGRNIDAINLVAIFKREITNHVIPLNDGILNAGSLPILQAIVLYLVSSINEVAKFLLIYSLSLLNLAAPILSFSGSNLGQPFVWLTALECTVTVPTLALDL